MSPTDDDDDDLIFADEGVEDDSARPAWTVLVVDDEPDIHAVTRLTLEHAQLAGRRVRLVNARSAAEGRSALAAHPETALILLDVVMESEDAGYVGRESEDAGDVGREREGERESGGGSDDGVEDSRV